MDVPEEMHRPVLLHEVLDWLRPRPGGTYVDGTMGLGGHTEKILEATEGKARVLGIEWDDQAADHAARRLARFGSAVEIVRENFACLPAILDNRNIRNVDGILLDLGVSSLQLDDPSRGFSFQCDGPLDMRMSRRSTRTAAAILRSWRETELEEVFRSCGEERRARRIARAIGRLRGKGPGRETGSGPVLERTRALAEFIATLTGGSGRIHPATRVFQALRIVVNDELGNLKKILEGVDGLLGERGRIVVVSFHSLEDRMVKRSFLEKAREGRLKILTKKPVVPTREEVLGNSRARSAKLRVAGKV